MLCVVTGPPASGKSTWVKERAKHGDLTIDFDELASALTPPGDEGHSYPHHVREVTKAVRRAAIDHAIGISHAVDVYIIHTTPSDRQLQRYERLGAEIITIDPGQDVVLERCRQQRPSAMLEVAQAWYAEQAWTPI